MSSVPERNSDESEERDSLEDLDLDILNSIDLDPSRSSISEVPEANIGAEEERRFYEDPRERMDRLKADGFEQDIKERRIYANKIFKLLSIWLVSVFTVIVFQGFSTESSSVKAVFKETPSFLKSFVFQPRFNLPDSVLLALIGGTTINVIGIFVIVANYLFPKYSKHDDSEPKGKDKV
jgi:hypothetical protein